MKVIFDKWVSLDAPAGQGLVGLDCEDFEGWVGDKEDHNLMQFAFDFGGHKGMGLGGEGIVSCQDEKKRLAIFLN